MPRGTCDYALEYDESAGLVSVQTAPAGRTCPVCGVRLSIYNHDELCAQCETRAGEPLSQEAVQAIFEAVCRALEAPLVDVQRPPRKRRRYLSVPEAARKLGVSMRTVEEWCKARRLRTKPKRNPQAPYKIVPTDVERELRTRRFNSDERCACHG